MSKTEIGRIELLLKNRLAVIDGHAEGHKSELVIEAVADPLDWAKQTSDRQTAVAIGESEQRMAEAIRDALQRIAAGTYGVCAGCEEEISPKRISAAPWATLCIDCQAHSERQEKNRNAKPIQKLVDHGRAMEKAAREEAAGLVDRI